MTVKCTFNSDRISVTLNNYNNICHHNLNDYFCNNYRIIVLIASLVYTICILVWLPTNVLCTYTPNTNRHTYIHTCMHTYIHTYLNKYIHTYTVF